MVEWLHLIRIDREEEDAGSKSIMGRSDGSSASLGPVCGI